MYAFKRNCHFIIIAMILLVSLQSCDTSETTDTSNNVEEGLTLVESEASDRFIALYKKGNETLRFEAIDKREVIQTTIYYDESNVTITQIDIPNDKKEIPELVNQAASVMQKKFDSKKASITALSNLYESFV